MSNTKPAPERRDVLATALSAIDTLKARIDELEPRRSEPIAIVGLACRFPGARSADEFWTRLEHGSDAIREIPDGRWDKSVFDDSEPFSPRKPLGGFMVGIDEFDAGFFGIARREAETMDPQQRLLLEVAWEALEDAQIPAADLRGSATGVYIGITTMDYGRLAISGPVSSLDVYTATGGALNVAAGRIAYTLGLHGPAAAIDSASEFFMKGKCAVRRVATDRQHKMRDMSRFARRVPAAVPAAESLHLRAPA